MTDVETTDTGGTVWDAPNKQVLGLDPPWVEGTGGEPGMIGDPKTETDSDAEQQPALDAMTKAELLEYAKAQGISPANNDMTKEELRTAIDEHEGG